MEEKLNAILGNSQMMQQIMNMAQSLSAPEDTQIPEPPPKQHLDFDPAMIQKIMSIAGQMRPDPQQNALLCALRPYLSGGRIEKLEKAMRAAKLANLASTAFSSGALSFLNGR